VIGKKSISSSHTLNDIGSAYYKQGKFDEALEYFNKSFAIKTKVKGKRSSDSVDLNCKMGLVYKDQDKLN
jgi:tetratricopeptide (TPR) repeat protein